MSTSQLELRSGDPHDACYLADARRRAGDVKGAINALKRATKRFPKFGPAWSDLARLLVKAKDPKRGAKAAKMATKLIPESPVAWSHLGNAAAALGNHRRALSAWEKALELEHPQRADVQEKVDTLLRKLRGRDGVWRGFERKDGAELWAIRIDGSESKVRKGKAGEKARKERREFNSPAAARRHAERLIAEKLREGYRRVRGRKSEDADESSEEQARPAPSKRGAKSARGRSRPKAPARRTRKLGKRDDDAPEERKATGRIGKARGKGTGRFGRSSARLEQAKKRSGKAKEDAPEKKRRSPGKGTARIGLAKGKVEDKASKAPKGKIGAAKSGKGKIGPAKSGKGKLGKGKAKPEPKGKPGKGKPKGNARLRGKAPAPRKRRLGR